MTITIIMKRGKIHLQITNLGWPEILCKSQDGYITSLDIQKNYFPNFTLKPPYFLDKFAEETTKIDLIVELFAATMSSKYKVKDFNQCFTTILNKFQPEAKPTQEFQIEVYDNSLPAFISMLVKRVSKHALDENFEEAKTNDFQMKGCKEGRHH